MFLNILGLADFLIHTSGNLHSPEVLVHRKTVILSLEHLFAREGFSSFEMSILDGNILKLAGFYYSYNSGVGHTLLLVFV